MRSTPASPRPLRLQVVEPHLNGPGGDVPIIVHDIKRGRTEVICGQGPAPSGATIAHYKSEGLEMVPGTGLLAACVPGTFEILDAAAARLRHDAAARRAGTGDCLRPRRLSAGGARLPQPSRPSSNCSGSTGPPRPRSICPTMKCRNPARSSPTSQLARNLYPHPQGSRKRRRRPRRADRGRAQGVVAGLRGRGDRQVLPHPGSDGRLRLAASRRALAPTTWRAGSRPSKRR